MEDLFPLRRSLTGDGVRETLRRIQREIPIEIHEVPLPLQAMDWRLENEWRFHSARLFDENGAVVIDAHNCALHCLGYSEPFTGWVNREELEEHLIVGPKEAPGSVPYATSYFEKRWAFCVSWSQHRRLSGHKFFVKIDTELFRGSLTYADLAIPGETSDEVMLDSYCCHSAGLANNEASGPTVLTALVQWWQEKPRRHTLRVLLAPETIGPLVYLSRPSILCEPGIQWHGPGTPEYGLMHVDSGLSVPLAWLRQRLRAGLTLTCLGGPGSFALQLGRRENYASKIARHIVTHEHDAEIRPWDRRASNERQWCAPGIDLPWATVFKTPPGNPLYPQYHTSADNLEFVRPEHLEESFALMKLILTAIEEDRRYKTTVLGEPQLSKRNLYPSLSKLNSWESARSLLITWSYADGRSLLENATEQGRSILEVEKEIRVLLEHGIVEVVK